MEAEVGHHRDGDEVDVQVEGEDGEDLVAVDRVALAVDREHPVAVTVEGDAEVVTAGADGLLEQRQVGVARSPC